MRFLHHAWSCEKICPTYFKIQGTYFEICQTYFSGAFLRVLKMQTKTYFTHVLAAVQTVIRRTCAGSCVPCSTQHVKRNGFNMGK